MKKLCAALVAFFLSINIAFAQTVFGAPDCGEWVQSPSNLRKTWLLGYLSGLNVQHAMDDKKPENPLMNLASADQAFLWMDNYCKANPLKKVTFAGWMLFTELKRP